MFALTAEDAAARARGGGEVRPGATPGRATAAHVRRARASAARPSFRFAVPAPAQREFFGNAEYARLFDESIERLRGLGGEPIEVDITPLLEAARLLYEGPWVAERYLATAVADRIATRGHARGHARASSQAGAAPQAHDAFRAPVPPERTDPRGASPSGRAPMCCCCPPPARTSASPRSKPNPSRSTAGSALHQLREPHGSRGRRRARRLHPRRPALRRLADRAGLERCGPAGAGRAYAARRGEHASAPRHCRCRRPTVAHQRPRASST